MKAIKFKINFIFKKKIRISSLKKILLIKFSFKYLFLQPIVNYLLNGKIILNKYQSLAECDEYAKYVYVDEVSPVLSASSQLDSISKCGIVETPLIVGGQRVNEIEFPHMVS